MAIERDSKQKDEKLTRILEKQGALQEELTAQHYGDKTKPNT